MFRPYLPTHQSASSKHRTFNRSRRFQRNLQLHLQRIFHQVINLKICPSGFPPPTQEIYQLLQHVSGLNSNQLIFLKIQRNTRLMVYTIPIPLVGPQTNSLSNVVQISPYKTFYLLLVPAVTNQLPSQLTAQVHRKCRSAHQSRNSTFFL